MAIDYSVKDLTLAQKMAAYKQGGVNTTSSYIWNPAWKGTMGGMMLGSKDAYITIRIISQPTIGTLGTCRREMP